MITILDATHEDIPALVSLLGILFQQEVEHHVDAKAQEEGLKQILDDPMIGKVFVLKEDGRCVAMVSLLFSISTALGSRAAWLEDMIVHPDYRNKQYGSMLLKHAIKQAQFFTCKRITLLTDADNAIAQHFYKQHGFILSSMNPFKLLL